MFIIIPSELYVSLNLLSSERNCGVNFIKTSFFMNTYHYHDSYDDDADDDDDDEDDEDDEDDDDNDCEDDDDCDDDSGDADDDCDDDHLHNYQHNHT